MCPCVPTSILHTPDLDRDHYTLILPRLVHTRWPAYRYGCLLLCYVVNSNISILWIKISQYNESSYNVHVITCITSYKQELLDSPYFCPCNNKWYVLSQDSVMQLYYYVKQISRCFSFFFSLFFYQILPENPLILRNSNIKLHFIIFSQ